MPEAPRFSYVALNNSGRRVRGALTAANADAAFDALKAQELSPLSIRPAAASVAATKAVPLDDRQLGALLADLAALLRAGADMRAALSIIGSKSGQPAVETMARQISVEISGGGALDQAFARRLQARHTFVAALITAGESSGDLAGGLERAAEMIDSQLQAKDQLISILTYPLFVLVSAIMALLVILMLVIPSLAPLAEAPGAQPGLAMRVLLFASSILNENIVVLGILTGVTAATAVAAGLLGLWEPLIDRFFLYGPPRQLAGALVYGGFSVALGGILAAGAPMSTGLRLAVRATRSGAARAALEPVLKSVREGQSLSTALGQVKGFPPAIVRLTVIGEQSGALGPMLMRAGRLEEKAALRAIETGGRILGPLLIVSLGGLIGLLMAGLLSGVSGLGEAALQ